MRLGRKKHTTSTSTPIRVFFCFTKRTKNKSCLVVQLCVSYPQASSKEDSAQGALRLLGISCIVGIKINIYTTKKLGKTQNIKRPLGNQSGFKAKTCQTNLFPSFPLCKAPKAPASQPPSGWDDEIVCSIFMQVESARHFPPQRIPFGAKVRRTHLLSGYALGGKAIAMMKFKTTKSNAMGPKSIPKKDEIGQKEQNNQKSIPMEDFFTHCHSLPLRSLANASEEGAPSGVNVRSHRWEKTGKEKSMIHVHVEDTWFCFLHSVTRSNTFKYTSIPFWKHASFVVLWSSQISHKTKATSKHTI